MVGAMVPARASTTRARVPSKNVRLCTRSRYSRCTIKLILGRVLGAMVYPPFQATAGAAASSDPRWRAQWGIGGAEPGGGQTADMLDENVVERGIGDLKAGHFAAPAQRG